MTAGDAPEPTSSPSNGPETPALHELDTLRSELVVSAWFADGTRHGEMVDLAHFTVSGEWRRPAPLGVGGATS